MLIKMILFAKVFSGSAVTAFVVSASLSSSNARMLPPLGMSHGDHIVDLQAQHPALSPSLILSSLADSCVEMGTKTLDVYGDFNLTSEESSLRKLEANLRDTFGKEDAVFMPSGVMAQNIALLIHATEKKKLFACHHSSHLLLHEQDAYRELLKMEPIIIDTTNEYAAGELHIPAMQFHHVKSIFLSHTNAKQLSTLLLELPHRELGGKLTPWPEVLQIGIMCRNHGVKYHCDGARIFEAAAGYG
jgi:threonine aldolase